MIGLSKVETLFSRTNMALCVHSFASNPINRIFSSKYSGEKLPSCFVYVIPKYPNEKWITEAFFLKFYILDVVILKD